MADLSENDVLSEGNEVSNTDTQETQNIETVSESDAEIDAINEVLAETEDLENTCETLGENLETDEPVEITDMLEAEENNTHDSEKDALSDSENDDISENNTHEVSEDNETGTVAENTTLEEPDFEIPEPEPYICPWADAPENTIYYEKMYEDGHLGSFTESPEMAYIMGWYENRISKDDVQQSDINGWTYRKEVCPMKSERDLQIEVWNREIFELKEELNRTDYKAIKYAEGVMTNDEYQPVGIQRQAWRHRINELEELIKA